MLRFDTVWREALAEVRDHASAYFTLAAAFSLLPALLVQLWLGPQVTAALSSWLKAMQAAKPGRVPSIDLPVAYWPATLVLAYLASVAWLTVNAVSGDAARSRDETVGATVRRMLPAAARYLLALVAIACAAGLAALLAAGLLGLVAGSATMTLLLVIVATVSGIWLAVRLSLLPSVYAVERSRLVAGPARAWALTRGAFWPLFQLLATLTVLYAVVVLTLSAMLQAGAPPTSAVSSPGPLSSLLLLAVQMVFNVVFAALVAVAYRRLVNPSALRVAGS